MTPSGRPTSDAGTDTTDYPALYRAAADAARRGRRNLTVLSAGDITFGLLAAVVALMAGLVPPPATPTTRPTPLDIALVAAAVPFIVSVALRLIGLASGYERDWYTGRALAEKLKSMTWRYQMAVAPYSAKDADRDFVADLLSLLRRAEVRQDLDPAAGVGGQITEQMRMSRGASSSVRIRRYVSERLIDQASWYRERGASDRRGATFWFWLGLVLQVSAVIIAIVAIALGADIHRGSDLLRLMALFATFALAGTAWSERNRFAQLADAYSVSMHELLGIASVAEGRETEEALAGVVHAGEECILREHHVWLARRVSQPE